MKLYVPDIGDLITLLEDWTFKIVYEHRNSNIIEVATGKPHTWSRDHRPTMPPMTLPKGTVLKIDRIYIRKGAIVTGKQF